MNNIKSKLFYKLNDDIIKIRKIVFCDEQGFNQEDEFDKKDNESIHIVVYYNNESVSTARLYKDSKGYHIGRVAVLKDYREYGFGKKMMVELEKQVRLLGGERIIVSSQEQASNFYKKLGYIEIGEKYFDEHCLHIDMIKELQRSKE